MRPELGSESADSPKGDVAGAEVGLPASEPSAVPLSEATEGTGSPTMEKVAAYSNLNKAFKRVAANKGAPGPDRRTIEEVREYLQSVLSELHVELLDGSFRPGCIRRVWIPKPGGGQRGLGIPNVVDRIVQQALLQVLSPLYEPTFHPSSHGFRPGRSCHTAIAEAVSYVTEDYDWVVDIDLAQFFDRVHHDRLLARLSERVHDKRLLSLIRRMLKAKVLLPDGVVVTTEMGTPQGGPLSPLLSNVVLDELDRELSRRGHRFVRYADDCNIYVRSERSGHRVMASICRFIRRRMRLEVNREKSAVARTEERHFVGFTLVPDAKGETVIVLPSKRSLKRLDAKIRQLTPRNWGRSFEECVQKINTYLVGWVGFFVICSASAKQRLEKRDKHIRRRLRAILLKQSKRKRTMARRLIEQGVTPGLAWSSIYQGDRSIWALSHIPAVDRAWRNRWFRKHGLVSLESTWTSRASKLKTSKLPSSPEQTAMPWG